MNRKEYFKIFQEATKMKILQSEDEFLKLLTVIGNNQRYSYSDQLSIYSKNPNAVACCDYNIWLKGFGRVVKAGQKGILIEEDGKFSHIFDVSQTTIKDYKKAKNFDNYIWKFQEKDKEVLKDIVSENALNSSDSLIKNIETLSDEYKKMYLDVALDKIDIDSKDMSSFDDLVSVDEEDLRQALGLEIDEDGNFYDPLSLDMDNDGIPDRYDNDFRDSDYFESNFDVDDNLHSKEEKVSIIEQINQYKAEEKAQRDDRHKDTVEHSR